MPFLETLLIVGGARLAAHVLNKLSTPDSPRPSIDPPEKVITFIGRTGVGKSSTANALLGYEAFATGSLHGTTEKVSQAIYRDGYSIMDTPGLFDTIDYSSEVWRAIRRSEIAIYTVIGQPYRTEMELIQEISSSQNLWNKQVSYGSPRRLFLYVNQQDIHESTKPKAVREQLAEAIRTQVSAWISPSQIAFGAAAPMVHGQIQAGRVDELKDLIHRHISK